MKLFRLKIDSKMVRLISLLGIKQLNQKKLLRIGDYLQCTDFNGLIHTLIWDCLCYIYISARLCSGR